MSSLCYSRVCLLHSPPESHWPRRRPTTSTPKGLDKQEELAARSITGISTEKTRQTTLCVIGDENGNVEHLQLLIDQSEKNGHEVKIFQSEKDIGGIKYCSALFAFPALATSSTD